jgi:hypothetical protein
MSTLVYYDVKNIKTREITEREDIFATFEDAVKFVRRLLRQKSERIVIVGKPVIADIPHK